MDEIDSSDGVWREVESDVDHKEMTRTYGCDDYLSRWLPDIKHRDESLRKEKSEKRPDKEHPNRLFKSPCHHHEGRILRESKLQQDPAKKTYFEAIKCSPMKLRQSIATFKRPKLDENFSLRPNHNTSLNHKPSNTRGEQATDLSMSMEDLTENILRKPVETKTSKPSVGIVEMQNDEKGKLGSLCFRKSLPENVYSENMYTSCNMIGGKLRKIHRETDRQLLLSARQKSKELLVRCESIMIYPKLLVNQKEIAKAAINRKQQSEKYKVNNQQQSDKYQVVANLQKHSNKCAPQPKEAWNDNTCQQPLELNSKSTERNYTQLPQIKDQTTQKEIDNQNTSSETTLDNPKGKTVIESCTIQRDKGQSSIESQITKNSASTKIIIPFGENDQVNQGVGQRISGDRCTSMKTRCLTKETSTLQKVQEVGPFKIGLQDEGVEGYVKKSGESDEHAGERGTPMKPRCLKESSKLNEQTHSTRRHSDVTLDDVRQAEMARKPVVTQYFTVNTSNTPLKRFRIPTGIENSELFVGRENYPPKTKTGPYRFGYNQRGLSEYTKSFDCVKQEDNGGQRGSLKIGGKGILKARLAGKVSGKLAEDENKKTVQFLVHNSRYFT